VVGLVEGVGGSWFASFGFRQIRPTLVYAPKVRLSPRGKLRELALLIIISPLDLDIIL